MGPEPGGGGVLGLSAWHSVAVLLCAGDFHPCPLLPKLLQENVFSGGSFQLALSKTVLGFEHDYLVEMLYSHVSTKHVCL